MLECALWTPEWIVPRMAYVPGAPEDPSTVAQHPAAAITTRRTGLLTEGFGAIHQTQQANMAHAIN